MCVTAHIPLQQGGHYTLCSGGQLAQKTQGLGGSLQESVAAAHGLDRPLPG